MLRVTVLNVPVRGSLADVLGYADISLDRTPLLSGSCQIQVFDIVGGMESTVRIDAPIALGVWALVAQSLSAATKGI